MHCLLLLSRAATDTDWHVRAPAQVRIAYSGSKAATKPGNFQKISHYIKFLENLQS